jgi:hypothetical protein
MISRQPNKLGMQHLINHVIMVLDRSDSMRGKPLVEVFDRELRSLKQQSVERNQETRISIYLFDNTIVCLTFDMDIMRFESLKNHYHLGGSTALRAAVAKAIDDHKQIPELYGDHANLVYVLTDGEENASRMVTTADLRDKLDRLPDNWTLACLVPDQFGKKYAQEFGFPGEAISIWDTVSAAGLEKVGQQFTSTMSNYMTMRASGVRGTKSIFQMDSSNLTTSKLDVVSAREYEIFPVRKDQPIKEFVESWTQAPYRLGSAYYQPVKTVKIQDHKQILVQRVKDGKVYEGKNLRQLIGLPAHTAEVTPTDHKDWRIFVQSTSVNRKLFQDTFVIVRK